MVKHFVVVNYEAKLLQAAGVDVTTKSGDVMSCHEVSIQHVFLSILCQISTITIQAFLLK